jgi:hypothetical protein
MMLSDEKKIGPGWQTVMTDCPREFCSVKAPYCTRAGDQYKLTAFCSNGTGCNEKSTVYLGTSLIDITCITDAAGKVTCGDGLPAPACPTSCTPTAAPTPSPSPPP